MPLTLSTIAPHPCLRDATGAGRASPLSSRAAGRATGHGPLTLQAFVAEDAPLARDAWRETGTIEVPTGQLALGAADDATPATAVARIPAGAYRVTFAPPSAEYLDRLTILALEVKARQAMVAMNIFILVTFLTFIAMAVLCLATGIGYAWGYLVSFAIGLAMLARAHHEHRAGARRYAATVARFPSVVAQLEPIAGR